MVIPLLKGLFVVVDNKVRKKVMSRHRTKQHRRSGGGIERVV